MNELKIYLDKNKQEEVKEKIEFEQIVAGKTTLGEIYVQNNLNLYMNVNLTLEGQNIKISKSIKELKPMELKRVEFKFTPKITTMKPINAKLKINIDYVVI